MDDITIGVTENVNNISVTAQPNDQIIDIAVTETVETVLLDVSTTVQEVSVTATQNVIVENITVDYVSNENHIDINVTDATQDVTLNVTPTLIEINILRSGGEVNILQFDSLADFPATGSSDYFYLAKDTNKLYRWTGSAYAEISATANAVWGQIIGTLSEQTDLQNALNLKAPINSPTFTGTVSGITKAMVGLGQVDNTSDLDKPISTATQTALNAKQPLDADLTSIAALSDTFGLLKKTANNSYTIDTNTYLTGITSSDVTTALGYTPENVANKGVNNGYASLGGDGKVPSSQLPSYVDDVIEVSSFGTLPTTGETGKIYITLDTNKIYRWTGSVYVEVSSSAAVWGGITGTLSNQTDLQSALDAKQDDLNGTGFVKASGTTISYDNTTYYPASNPNGYTSNVGTVTSVALTVPSAFSVSGSPVTSSGTLAITGAGTTAQYVRGDGTLATMPDISGFVPYTGATGNVDLGTHTIIAAKGTFSSSGSGDTVGITHSSGSGIALNISKAGNGEGIYVNKTSGSGNAVTIIGTLNATTLVKSGGTSTQFLKADGSVDSSTYLTSASLSGYVDTTGDQSIAGQKTFTGFAYFDNTIFLKQTTSISFISGYNSIAASSSGIRMGITSGISALFNLTSLTSNRDYILPNDSGTLALTSDIPSLAGYVATTGDQSISGNKTFTTAVLANLLKFNESGGFNNVPGYTQIGGTADNFIFINGAGTKQAKFIYNSGGGNDYTLPTGNGTLALTSDLHNAVTIGTANGLSLSTQVLSLGLASTSTTGALSSTDWNTFNGKQNALTNPVTGTGTSSYLPKFTGTSAIGNSLLYDTGSVLLVGATSASDSQSKLELVGASPVGLKIISSAGNGNNTFLSIQASKEWRFLTNRGDLISGNQGDLIIRNNTDGINHIILNQGGSTTFAGSVTADSLLVSASDARIRNTDASGRLVISNSVTSTYGIFYGSTHATSPNVIFFANNSAATLTLNANNTATFSSSVTATQVSIGTTSPATFLHVNGATAALPATSGTTQSAGNRVRLSTAAGTGILDMGCAGGTGMWLQSTDLTDLSLKYPLLLNPNGGNVGIGTTAPSHRLDIQNGSDFDIRLRDTSLGGTVGILFETANDFSGTSQAYIKGIGAGNSGVSQLIFGTSGSSGDTVATERMRLSSAGELMIGNTNAGFSSVNRANITLNASSSSIFVMQVNSANDAYLYTDGANTYLSRIPANGNIFVTANTGGVYLSYGATSWTANSDLRLKNITGNIENAVESLMTLKPIKHTWKSDNSNKEHLALIAQEVEKVFPQLIDKSKLNRGINTSTDETEYLGVRYTELVPVLVKAIQELKAELDTLKNK